MPAGELGEGGFKVSLPVDADIQEADEVRYKAVGVESVLAKERGLRG